MGPVEAIGAFAMGIVVDAVAMRSALAATNAGMMGSAGNAVSKDSALAAFAAGSTVGVVAIWSTNTTHLNRNNSPPL